MSEDTADTSKKSTATSGGTEILAPEGKALRDEYSKRWYRQLMISGQVLLFAFPVMIMSDDGDTPTWLLVVMMVSVLGGLFGSLKNWRCPNCSTYFGKRFLFIRHCATCGVKLVE